MKRKTASIISELLVIAVGLFFIIDSIRTFDPRLKYYESPALYPVLVSSIMIVAALVALFKDLTGKTNSDGKKIDIPNIKGFFIAIAIIIVVKLLWQFLDIFYVAIFLGIAAMLFLFHDKDKPMKTRLIVTAAGSIGATVIIYVVFGLLLGINF